MNKYYKVMLSMMLIIILGFFAMMPYKNKRYTHLYAYYDASIMTLQINYDIIDQAHNDALFMSR